MRRRIALRSRGFTVLELMVGIAILSIAAAAVSASLRPPGPGILLNGAVAETLAILRGARNSAIMTGENTAVVFDIENRTISHGDRVRALPEPVTLVVTGADAERRSAQAIGIRYLPSGRSTGGRVMLSVAGRSEIITVDWLTGEPRHERETAR